MKRMLCWTEVEDFDRWIRVFKRQVAESNEAGLVLEHLWREVGDPTRVHFVFLVEDIDKANAYMAQPHHADVATEAGALDGSFVYVEPAAEL